ncbi:MAG: OmpA family protein [Flavobacteriaceae bacterium]|nr:OmpA family protein [Flavobacteriaceae bacterium]
MKNFLTAFIVFMVWSVFGLWIYSWLLPENATAKTEIKNTTPIPEIVNESKQDPSKADTSVTNELENKMQVVLESSNIELKNENIQLKATNANGDIIFVFNEGIGILKDKTEVFIPKKSIDYKYKINTYLIEHPNQEVHINSLYSPTESVSSPNMGIRRGFEIEKQLIKTGVNKERIVIKPIIKDINFNNEGNYNSAINFSFKELDFKRVEETRNSIPDSRIVYPNFTDSGISVNNDLKILLSELIVYFSENPDSVITIVGHTDNIGNSNDNYNVGLKYARQVRWYLISKGDLKKSQLKAASKGESEPIESNYSKKGRTVNKRIEVIY